MHLKPLFFAGAAAFAMAMPMSAGSALAANDTYRCNDERCYDDQADQTRELNRRSLDQAQRENEDDNYNGMGGPSYDDEDDAYRDNGRDRDGMYGDDHDRDDGVDTNPYDDDRDDNND